MSTILDMIRLSTTDNSELTVVSAKQGDNLSAILPIKIYNDQTEIDLSEYGAVSFNGIKSDKSAVLYLSTDEDGYLKISDNTIYLTLTSALLAVDGTCECEIALYKGEEIRSAYGFNIYVYKSPSDMNRYSESDLNSVKNAVKDIQVYSESAKASADNAKISEDNASASAEASLSNAVSAKENADRSAECALTAQSSALTASTKANEAGVSAGNAKNSADSARLSEENAETSEVNAKTSELNAAGHAASASGSAAQALSHATEAKSYAHGSTGTRENEDADNAMYYYNQAKQISQGLNGITPMGTVAFEDLPVTEIAENAMYNISNAFTSDSRFNDGGGIYYGAGNNVIYTADGKWDVLASSNVTGVKGDAESTYRQGNVNLTAENIGAAPLNHAHSYLPLSGGTVTGTIYGSDGGQLLADGNVFINGMGWISDLINNIRNTYLPLSGGTVTGKTSFGGGLAITSGSEHSAMPFFLGIEGFASGGDVRWIKAADVVSAIGAAASSHSHKYAGSSSAVGAATSALVCTGNSATATTSTKWNGYAMRTGTSGAAGYITFQI